jgi:hypothetical protein
MQGKAHRWDWHGLGRCEGHERGRLADAELDAQMDEIGTEQAALEAQIAELGGKIASADSIAGNIASAHALLVNQEAGRRAGLMGAKAPAD